MHLIYLMQSDSVSIFSQASIYVDYEVCKNFNIYYTYQFVFYLSGLIKFPHLYSS